MNNSTVSFATNRKQPINRVCESVTVDTSSQSATACLIVDRSHPFFFDHDLDHIPGLLLAEGICQIAEILVNNQNLKSNYIIRELYIDFIKFCTFSRQVNLLAKVESIQEEKAVIYVESTQSGKPHCVASVVLDASNTTLTKQPVKDHRFSITDIPCPKEFIRKSNQYNVMIATPKKHGSELHTGVLKPSKNNSLNDHACGLYHPLYILEAFMQVQRYLNHIEAKVHENNRIRDILVSTDITLTRQTKQNECLTLVMPDQNTLEDENSVSEHVRTAIIYSSTTKVGKCSIRTRCFKKTSVAKERCKKHVSDPN